MWGESENGTAYTEAEITAYVAAHPELSPGQRACYGALLSEFQPPPGGREKAAVAVSVSIAYVGIATLLLRRDPLRFERVRQGEESLYAFRRDNILGEYQRDQRKKNQRSGTRYPSWISIPTGRRVEIMRELVGEGMNRPQIAEATGLTEESIGLFCKRHDIVLPDHALEKTRRTTREVDSNQVVQGTVEAILSLATGIKFVNINELDPERLSEWIRDLGKGRREVNRLFRALRDLRFQLNVPMEKANGDESDD